MPIKLQRPGTVGSDGVGHMDAAAFEAAGREALSFLTSYWRGLGSGEVGLPVRPGSAPGAVIDELAGEAPEQPQAWAAMMEDVRRLIVPGLTHWQSPDFYAYFPANSSAPAVLGELLSAGLGVNGMLWATSPAATELEVRLLDVLGVALGLPEKFDSRVNTSGGGVIQGTASEATLCALLAARRRWRAGGRVGVPTLYASEQAHSSVLKAAMIAGLADDAEDRTHVRIVAAGADHAMDLGELSRLVRADRASGRTPMFACATLGTTGTMAFDDVVGVGRVLDEPRARGDTRDGMGGAGAWLHVDAAMAGAAWVCPELRGRCGGPEGGLARADSLCFNPHKWLLVSFDCDLMWTSDTSSLVEALSVTPEYLRVGTDAGDGLRPMPDYRDWGVPLGRRFRSLKLWLVLRHYGLSGLRAYIREHLRLTAVAQGLIEACPALEVCAARDASSPLVVFACRAGSGESAASVDGRTRVLMERLNAGGTMLLSHTVLPMADARRPGGYVIRMCVGSVLASEAHVRRACAQITEAAMEATRGLGAAGGVGR
jgi:aromatic-L-amino-acid decarboxylase